jgi:hypothetical protein
MAAIGSNDALSLTATAVLASAPAAAADVAADAAAVGSAGRTAHWVIRCTDLGKFLEFAKACFGMRVILTTDGAGILPGPSPACIANC